MLGLCMSYIATSFCDSWSTRFPHASEHGVPLLLDFHHLMVMKLSDWSCPLAFTSVCGHVPTDIFIQEPVLECMFIRSKYCISKNCSCPWVSIAYFRPAGKNGILHLYLPVQCCQYFCQCLCFQLVSASLVCDFFRCTMNGGEGF